MPEKKFGGHRARLREKQHLSRYRAQFEGNLLRFVRSRAYVRALMTQKSCAVGMRNAILRNYLKSNTLTWDMLAGNHMAVAFIETNIQSKMMKTTTMIPYSHIS